MKFRLLCCHSTASYEDDNSSKRSKTVHLNEGFVNDDLKLTSDSKIDDDVFKKILLDFNLPENKIETMLKLPNETKINLLLLNQRNLTSNDDTSQSFIESLNRFSNIQDAFSEQNKDNEPLFIKCSNRVDELKLALRIRPISFVTSFLEQNGFEAILNFLNTMNSYVRENTVHLTLISCIKALMNNTKGRQYVLDHEHGINVLIQSLHNSNVKVQTLVLQMLSAICFLTENSHQKVFASVKYFKNYAKERFRFQTLINFLDDDRNSNDPLANNLKIAALSFINAIINKGVGEKSIEFRLHLRYEFLMLGIQSVLDKLRTTYSNPSLNYHIDYFETTRYDDEYAYACIFNETHINTRDATKMFDLLCKRLLYSKNYSNFLSILHHFLLATLNNKFENPKFWSIIDLIIQQFVLQLADGKNLDDERLTINFSKLLEKSNEENEDNLQQQEQINSFKIELNEISAKLSKKTQECDELKQETDKLHEALKQLRQQLDTEVEAHKSLKEKFDHKQQAPVKIMERRMQNDADLNTSTAMAKLPLTTTTSSIPADPPPPPPPLNIPPPPPPPPMPLKGFGGSPPSPTLNKNIPKSNIPMKCFNWNKIPLYNYDKTLWKNLNEEKLYEIIDLNEFQRTFSAYQQKLNSEYELTATMSTSPQQATHVATAAEIKKPKEFSVIDSRRARNCTILLSTLKRTNEELTQIILKLDPNDDLQRDSIEQMLKFIPTIEEETLLQENRLEYLNMAKADRFLFEMSKIFRYKHKLKVLFFKKKYFETYKELTCKIQNVTDLCQNLLKNANILNLLEIVLALGNFMNQSQKKGVAVGFSVSNLNKLIDIKSSNDKSFSMLHFIINTIQDKFPDLIQLPEQLHLVNDVAKINLADLENDWEFLENGFYELGNEIEVHIQNEHQCDTNDEFVKWARNFQMEHEIEIQHLKTSFSLMRSEYSKTIKYFGEDEVKIKFEEFFQMWHVFIQSFNEIKVEIKNRKQRELDEEKKTKEHESVPKARNRHSINAVNSLDARKISVAANEPDFDNLVNAIFTGNAYPNRYPKRNLGIGGGGRRKASASQCIDNFHFHRERVLSQE